MEKEPVKNAGSWKHLNCLYGTPCKHSTPGALRLYLYHIIILSSRETCNTKEPHNETSSATVVVTLYFIYYFLVWSWIEFVVPSPDSREEHNIHTRTASVCKWCRVGLERVSSRLYFIVHHSTHSTPAGVRGRSYFRILGIRLNRISEVKNVRELYNIIIFNVIQVVGLKRIWLLKRQYTIPPPHHHHSHCWTPICITCCFVMLYATMIFSLMGR